MNDSPAMRSRAQMSQVAHAVQLRFDGNGDLLLDLLSRAPRPLRDHPDVLVGHIGIGFDRAGCGTR